MRLNTSSRSLNARLASVALLGVLALGACGGDGDSAPDGPTTTVAADATVSIKNTAFNPADTTVQVGGTVAWTFGDGALVHNVTFADFHSDTISKGTFTHTFDAAGTFDYVCTLHPGMKGTVTVG